MNTVMCIKGSGTSPIGAPLRLRLPSLLFVLLGCHSVPDITLLKLLISLNVILNPVLVPLSLFQGKDAQGEVCSLDRLSWANVGLAHSNFCWAHVSVALTVIICLWCVAGIFAVLVSMIWGFQLYWKKGRMIDGLDGNQYLSLRILYMMFLDFRRGHGQV